MVARRLLARSAVWLATSTLLVPLSAAGAGAATTSTTVLGTVDRVVVDSVHDDGATLQTRVFVQAGGRLLDVPPALTGGLVSGEQVRVTLGTAAPRYAASTEGSAVVRPGPAVLAVSPVRPRLRTAARAATTVSPIGSHTLTVLPVYWASRDTQTQSSLTSLASETAAYWSEQSAGRIVVNPVVRDWAKIADPGSCDPGALFDRALAANGLAAPTSLTQHVMIYFPSRSDCAWAGLGSISGSRIWDNGYLLNDVSAHELGHNFGIGHANRAACTNNGLAVPFSSSCQVGEYQDTADIMGFATGMRSGNLNSALADWLGLVQSVTASSTSATTVDLAPLAQAGATRALKVNVGTGWVYLDFRPAAGRDVRMPAWAGVQAHYLPNGPYPQSQLLDLQAGTAAAFQQVSLPAWSVWPVPGAGVSVEVTGVGSTATVRVVPTAGDTTAPSAPTLTVARPTGTGSSLVASWTAATDAGSGIGAYTVLVDGTVAARTGPDARQAAVTASGTARTVRVEAVDLAGNVTSSTAVAVPGTEGSPGSPPEVTDSTPPSSPVVTAPTAGQVSATRVTRWSWTGADDAESGIAGYRLYANRAAIGAVLPGVATVQISLPEGTTLLGVSAVNGAGLSSAPVETSVTVDSVAPAAPAGLALAAGGTSGTSGTSLTWTAPRDTGTTLAYLVSVDGAAATRVSGTSLATTVNAAARHTWTVRAVDLAGNTSPAATLVTATDTTAPTAPVIVSPSGRSATLPLALTWRAAADPESGVVRYLITLDGVQVASTEGLTATVPASVLAPGRTVGLVVWAVNGAGLRTASAKVSVSLPTTSARTRVAAAEPRRRAASRG